MSDALDLPAEAFYLQQEAFWGLSDLEAGEKLLAKFPHLLKAEVDTALMQARRLHHLSARGDFYLEPSVEAVTNKAMPYLREGAPGLSDRAYSAALHRILYSWMK